MAHSTKEDRNAYARIRRAKLSPEEKVKISLRDRHYYHQRKQKPGFKREYHLHVYGLTVETYDRLLKQQGGTCALCPREPWEMAHGRFHVDHNHATGQVRGLLCFHCNAALGHLGDTPEGLRKALSYLERDDVVMKLETFARLAGADETWSA